MRKRDGARKISNRRGESATERGKFTHVKRLKNCL